MFLYGSIAAGLVILFETFVVVLFSFFFFLPFHCGWSIHTIFCFRFFFSKKAKEWTINNSKRLHTTWWWWCGVVRWRLRHYSQQKCRILSAFAHRSPIRVRRVILSLLFHFCLFKRQKQFPIDPPKKVIEGLLFTKGRYLLQQAAEGRCRPLLLLCGHNKVVEENLFCFFYRSGRDSVMSSYDGYRDYTLDNTCTPVPRPKRNKQTQQTTTGRRAVANKFDKEIRCTGHEQLISHFLIF